MNHNQDAFFESIASFVKQVDEVDYINLFLTVIGFVARYCCWTIILSVLSRGSLPTETVARVCDAVRTDLEKISLTKYVNSILTAYVVKTPPDLEFALSLLLRLRGKYAINF